MFLSTGTGAPIQAAEPALPSVVSGARFLLQGCALKQGLGVQWTFLLVGNLILTLLCRVE